VIRFGSGPFSDILEEFERQGAPLDAARPDSAVRTALSTATEQGRIIRLERGLYQAGPRLMGELFKES